MSDKKNNTAKKTSQKKATKAKSTAKNPKKVTKKTAKPENVTNTKKKVTKKTAKPENVTNTKKKVTKKTVKPENVTNTNTKQSADESSENKPITVTAYARHRKSKNLPGGTHQAVNKAIESARLLKSVKQIGKKKMIISIEMADKEWASKTTPNTQTDQNQDPAQEQLDLQTKETSTRYTSARARRLDAQADLAEIELARARSEVLDLHVAGRILTTIGAELIQGLTNISRTNAAIFAAETNAQIIRIKLQEVQTKLVEETIKNLTKVMPHAE